MRQYRNGKCVTHGGNTYPCAMGCRPGDEDNDNDNPTVAGYDAAFWHDSYCMVRDAVIEHLGRFVREDDVAEEAIIVDAIERAGKHANDGAALPAEHAPLASDSEKLTMLADEYARLEPNGMVPWGFWRFVEFLIQRGVSVGSRPALAGRGPSRELFDEAMAEWRTRGHSDDWLWAALGLSEIPPTPEIIAWAQSVAAARAALSGDQETTP